MSIFSIIYLLSISWISTLYYFLPIVTLDLFYSSFFSRDLHDCFYSFIISLSRHFKAMHFPLSTISQISQILICCIFIIIQFKIFPKVSCDIFLWPMNYCVSFISKYLGFITLYILLLLVSNLFPCSGKHSLLFLSF